MYMNEKKRDYKREGLQDSESRDKNAGRKDREWERQR